MASSPKALEDEMIPISDETQFYDQTFQSSSNNLNLGMRHLDLARQNEDSSEGLSSNFTTYQLVMLSTGEPDHPQQITTSRSSTGHDVSSLVVEPKSPASHIRIAQVKMRFYKFLQNTDFANDSLITNLNGLRKGKN
jgi:hypothetical protein